MKTTVEISDALLARARKLASRRGTTVRALVEEGLRRVVAEERSAGRFVLRDASYGTGGLRPDAEGGWDRIRDLAYEGRGT
jgi:Arc/MetJ family transcription regulator